MNQDELLDVLNYGLSVSRADQTEVVGGSHDAGLTRFSNSTIHQNVAERNVHFSVRVAVGKRLGFASTNRVDREAIRQAVDSAIFIAEHRPEDKTFHSLPERRSLPAVQTWFESTARCGPAQRASQVARLIKKAKGAKLDAAGSFANSSGILGVMNSLGVEATARFTDVSVRAVLSADAESGYAESLSRNLTDIDVGIVAEEATRRAAVGLETTELPSGSYPVVLEPEAVADMVAMLGYFGFGALAYQEGRSFVSGKLGQKVTGENITIWDDGLDPRTAVTPFDFEGVPKQKVMLLEKGVARGVVYDSYTAAKEGRESTGHALPAPNPHGPMPTNLLMATGSSTLEEMIAGVDHGLLISRFHYTNVEDPIKMVLTGMTRDGTFLIKDGRVRARVRNLRFTQSILEAFSNVEMISRDSYLKGGDLGLYGATCAPAVKISRFSFTGTTL